MDSYTFVLLMFSLLLGQFALTVGKEKDPMIKSCEKISPCKCKTPDLGEIDLEPLSHSDGTPRFEHITSGIQEYSWNPCKPFNQGDCKKVAVCQKSTFPTVQYYNLGTQDTAQFKADDKSGLQVIYTANSWPKSKSDVWQTVLADSKSKTPADLQQPFGNVSVTFMRTSFVRLVCDLNNKPGTLSAEGEDKNWPGRYYFTLTSYHACPSYLKPKPASSSSALSTGSCLLIICFVMAAFYLVVGSAIQIFMFKRTGTDAIPNKTFWVTLPELVKEGTIFVLKGRRNTGYSEV